MTRTLAISIFSLAILASVILSTAHVFVAAAKLKKHELPMETDFCVVGGGPAGIQLGYFLQRYKLDYVVLERNSRPGSFFEKYPRQGNLISINKAYTGTNDTEFNLRHDWNSLLGGDDDYFFPPKVAGQPEPGYLFKEVSQEYYPVADDVPVYLEGYLERNPDVRIVFDTEVDKVMREKKKKKKATDDDDAALATGDFHVFLTSGKVVRCRKAVILATGKSVEKPVKLREGTHLAVSYTDAPTDPEDYANQDVLIIGGGNSAFELARSIESHAALVHIASRNPIQLAYQTHYVGHVRAVNLGFLDRYQLKSNDALIGTPSHDVANERLVRDEETGRVKLLPAYIDPAILAQLQEAQQKTTPPGSASASSSSSSSSDSQALTKSSQELEQERMQKEATAEIYPARRGYHRVIVCTGFTWNSTPFFSSATPASSSSSSASTESARAAIAAAKKTLDLVPVEPTVDSTKAFVEVASNYESVNVPDLFVSGALAHFRDFKKSSGGFIHGFRYTARVLVTMLRERYLSSSSPSSSSSAAAGSTKKSEFEYPYIPMSNKEQILERFLFRLHNVSSLYQMTGSLCDAVVLPDDNSADDRSSSSGSTIRYYQDLPFDNVKSKIPALVSINAFKKPAMRFLTLTLEFGQDFQGVGTLHHHSQKETYRRRAEKLLWDVAIPTSDPDVRHYIAQRLNPGKPLPMQEKVTSRTLMAREDQAVLDRYNNISVDLANLLNPLQPPPTMMPAQNGRPPKLSRFLFLHPVIREWKRTSENSGGGGGPAGAAGSSMPAVKNQLIREVRLHEDVLNDFTGFWYAQTPLRNFLDRALEKQSAKK